MSKTILTVDDSRTMREMLKYALTAACLRFRKTSPSESVLPLRHELSATSWSSQTGIHGNLACEESRSGSVRYEPWRAR